LAQGRPYFGDEHELNYIQGVPRGIVDILGGSMDYSE